MRISIIIPMYNAATSIEKCLISTQQQDIPCYEYEVIVINDGSKDDSLSTASTIASRFENVKIYTQENSGLSVARNAGLDRAKGKYIMFLDSDDWIAENCLKKIITTCEVNKLDMLRICAANVIDGVPTRRFSLKEGIVRDGIDSIDKSFTPCAPFQILNKAFMDKFQLRFFPGIFHEDGEFTPRVYCLAKRVMCINDICYYVYQTPGSITRSVNIKKPLDIIIVNLHLHKFCKTAPSKAQIFLHSRMMQSMNSAFHQANMMSRKEQEIVNQNFYRVRFLFKHGLKAKKWKYKIEAIALILFPKHAVQIYKYLNN